MSQKAEQRYVNSIFTSTIAARGGPVYRKRSDVQLFGSVSLLIDEAKKRGFHVFEVADWMVVFCTGEFKVAC
jgi:hypothetical protein